MIVDTAEFPYEHRVRPTHLFGDTVTIRLRTLALPLDVVEAVETSDEALLTRRTGVVDIVLRAVVDLYVVLSRLWLAS